MYWKKLILLFVFILPQVIFATESFISIDPYGHSDMIKDVMFTPDGKKIISVSRDKTIRLWEIENGKFLKTIRGEIRMGHKGEIFCGALSPQGKIIAVAGYFPNYTIRLINIETGEQIATLEGHMNVIIDLEFSENGSKLFSVSNDNSILVWNLSSINPTEYYKGYFKPKAKLNQKERNINDISISPDGSNLVVASGKSNISLYQISDISCKLIKKLQGHTDEVYCVKYSPNGEFIASGGFDGKVILWDKNGKLITEIDKLDGNVTSISFSDDSQSVLAAEKENFSIAVYNLSSGNKISTFNKHKDTVVASDFYGKDIIVTAGGKNNEIFVWNSTTGKIIQRIEGKGKPIYKVIFGKKLKLAFTNQENSTVKKVFDFDNFTMNTNFNKYAFPKTNQSYQGKYFEEINSYKLKIVDGGVIKNNRRFDGNIRSYSFTNSGNVIVGSSYSLKLYDIGGKLLRNFKGHTGEIWSVAVSRDGSILASGSSDQTIKLWNLKTGKLLVTLFVTNDNEWICWRPDGYYSASAGGEKYIGFHINRGPKKSAIFNPAYSFRKKYMFKDLVRKKIIECIENDNLKQKLSSSEDIYAKNIDEVDKQHQKFIYPKIAWIEPKDDFETYKNEINIRFEISSLHPIKNIILKNNNRKVISKNLIGNLYKKSIDEKISLSSGKNNIIVTVKVAGNSSKSSARAVFFLDTTSFEEMLPPTITWNNPKSNMETDNSSLPIEIELKSDLPIIDYKILLNGRTYSTKNEIIAKPAADNTLIIRDKISLNEGKNNISIIAENENAICPPKSIIVELAKSNKVESNRKIYRNIFILSVGINECDNNNFNISYADEDAFKFINIFTKQSGLSCDSVYYKLITGKRATRGSIIEGLLWLQENARQNDLTFVAITGNGFNDLYGRYYLLPTHGDPKKLRRTGIAWYEFNDILGNIKSKVILFINTENSGNITKKAEFSFLNGRENITEAIREISSNENGVIVFSNQNANKSSKPNNSKSSPFIRVISNAIKDRRADYNNDKRITAEELKKYVPSTLKSISDDNQNTTVLIPQSSGNCDVYLYK